MSGTTRNLECYAGLMLGQRTAKQRNGGKRR